MIDERAHGPTGRPTKRRRFFRRVAAVGGGAIGGAIVGGGAFLALGRASEPRDPRPAQATSGEQPPGYRLTDHIATYYEKARF